MGYLIVDKERGEAVGTIVYVWETPEAQEAYRASGPGRFEAREGAPLPRAKALEAFKFPGVVDDGV